MRTMIAVLAAVLLAGCAADTLVQRRMNLMPQGQSAEYKVGFEDGCHSAVHEQCMASETRFRRDDARMKTDAEYALGWGDGARICACGGSTFMFMPPK